MPKVMSNNWYNWDSNLKVSLAIFNGLLTHPEAQGETLSNTSHLEK